MNARFSRGQEKGSGSPGGELYVIVSHQMWVPGNALGSCGGTVSTVTFPAMSPAPGQTPQKCLINK